MKALAVFPSRREVRIIDHATPQVTGSRQVKVRVLEVGLCGTDREIAAFDYGTPPAGSDYLVLGHESLCQVVETGPEVRRLRPGDLAVLMVRRGCSHPECLACPAGRPDFCYTGEFTERGIKGEHGFMTTFVVDDESHVVPVPPALREVGVLTEPLTIAQKALAQVWEVQQRLPWACHGALEAGPGACHRAVVLGAGPVGLLGAMALVAAGFDTTVYSRGGEHSDKASLTESFGARFVPAESRSVDDLAAVTGNVDLVYEATGASRVAFDMLRLLGPNAVFVFTGVPGRKAPIEVAADLIMRRLVLHNQVILGTVNAPRQSYEDAIRDLGVFLDRWPGALRGLITLRVALDEGPRLLRERPAGIKTVVVPQ